MCAREVKISNVLFHTETRFQVCIARPALIGELFTTEPSGKLCTALPNHESPQQWIDLDQFNSTTNIYQALTMCQGLRVPWESKEEWNINTAVRDLWQLMTKTVIVWMRVLKWDGQNPTQHREGSIHHWSVTAWVQRLSQSWSHFVFKGGKVLLES